MDFIVNNIVWFIVVGVVILMTIIGYLAEKTDFASKKYHDKMIDRESNKKDKSKEKKNKEKIQKSKENNNKMGATDAVSPIQNNTPDDKKENEVVDTIDDLYLPLDNNVPKETNDVPDELFAPLGNMENRNEFVNENNNLDTISSVDSNSLSGKIGEDLYAPLGDTNMATSVDNTIVNATEELPIETLEPVSNETVNSGDMEPLEVMPEMGSVNESTEVPMAEIPIVENNNNVFEQSLENLEVPIEQNVFSETQNATEESIEALDIQTPGEIQPQVEIQPEEKLEEVKESGFNTENLRPENIINITPTEESLKMPNEVETPIDNEQFDKIFPDDPVIINDTHKGNEEVSDTIEPQTVMDNQETEDVWKF